MKEGCEGHHLVPECIHRFGDRFGTALCSYLGVPFMLEGIAPIQNVSEFSARPQTKKKNCKWNKQFAAQVDSFHLGGSLFFIMEYR